MNKKHKTTKGGKLIAPVFDIGSIFCTRVYTAEIVEKELALIKEMGFTRAYAVLCSPGYPTFAVPEISPVESEISHIFTTEKNLGGDPNAFFARACKKAGLTPCAIIKPYENGGGVSVPEGIRPSDGSPFSAEPGGNYIYYDTLSGARPELRVARRPEESDDRAIEKIEITFITEGFEDRFKNRLRSFPPVKIENPPAVNLWVSRDNGSYEPYAKKLFYSYKTERRQITDSNGHDVFGGPLECLVLTIDGLELDTEYKYVAVGFESREGLRTLPHSLIKIYGGGRELKNTAVSRVRRPLYKDGKVFWDSQRNAANGVDAEGIILLGGLPAVLGENADKEIEGFCRHGFDFHKNGAGLHGCGVASSVIFAIARGRMSTLGGTLCEAYPEVRKYWLDQVGAAIDAGYEVIDIRLQAHGSWGIDFESYGFNEPLVQRYKQLYGADILSEKADYVKLMKVRGDFFMLFLEEAAALAHRHGRLLQTDLGAAHENPQSDAHWSSLCHCAMPKIALDWRRCVELADEITIKDYYWGSYDPASAAGIKDYAKSLSKPLWIHSYLQQAEEWTAEYIAKVERDDRVSGILLYEVTLRSTSPEKISEVLLKVGFGG